MILELVTRTWGRTFSWSFFDLIVSTYVLPDTITSVKYALKSCVITQDYSVINCNGVFHGFYLNNQICWKKWVKCLLHKEDSRREFATASNIKYSLCVDPLLEGDRLKPGELNTLCCIKDYEAVTNFDSMTNQEKDGHLYQLFGRLSKFKSEEYMRNG